MTSTFRRSPLALAVLGLLEVGPMHPYAIQQLIKQWGKDQVVNVGQRATLYKMINRLLEAGLIEVKDSDRAGRYPERTTYAVTDAGSAAASQWLAEIVSTPRNEFPEFPAALSFLPMITPQTAVELLSTRRDRLIQRLAELDADLATVFDGFQLPRVTLLDTEYNRALVDAELRWVTAVLDALQDGSLTWNVDELRTLAAQFTPD